MGLVDFLAAPDEVISGDKLSAVANRHNMLSGSYRMNLEVPGKSKRDRQMEETPPETVNPSTFTGKTGTDLSGTLGGCWDTGSPFDSEQGQCKVRPLARSPSIKAPTPNRAGAFCCRTERQCRLARHVRGVHRRRGQGLPVVNIQAAHALHDSEKIRASSFRDAADVSESL